MWECYRNDIYLLFLPSHSSHVLQPLDLSVFSPLKRFYRQELSAQEIQSDLSPIGKVTFLHCYIKARVATMIESTIKAGWKAAGLWPVNVSKPLLNPYVAQPLAWQPTQPLTPEKASMKRQREDNQALSTPRGSHHVRKMVRGLLDQKQIDPTTRLLFRKICKGLDDQNTQISLNAIKIRNLEAQNRRLQPRKKAKVIEDPNNRFVRIEQIMEAKQRVTTRLDANQAAQSTKNYIFEELCFEWQLE
jgi:hypothetical protein